ncbi:hypothetical protein (plasmid) [Metabacillus dongyingensis]|nr:hypothetical protein [Metabacillus dongyingensis]
MGLCPIVEDWKMRKAVIKVTGSVFEYKTKNYTSKGVPNRIDFVTPFFLN